jgi:hypothetical protein
MRKMPTFSGIKKSIDVNLRTLSKHNGKQLQIKYLNETNNYCVEATFKLRHCEGGLFRYSNNMKFNKTILELLWY